METRHQSVRDYIAARERGDADGASAIAQEVAEITEASMAVPLGE